MSRTFTNRIWVGITGCGLVSLLLSCTSARNVPKTQLTTCIGPYAAKNGAEKIEAQTWPPSVDDLLWMVGRWRCITRDYANPSVHPGNPMYDLWEYFNVYFPYVDDNLTVLQADNPGSRRIAAEFVVRDCIVSSSHGLTERCHGLVDGTPISIDKTNISAGHYYGFEYRRLTNTSPEQLVLETSDTRLVFEKLPFFTQEDMTRDIKNSFVGEIPIKYYTQKEIEQLEEKYFKLIKQQQNHGAGEPAKLPP